MYALSRPGYHSIPDYLAWQSPNWFESGYFWTNERNFVLSLLLLQSNQEHPFVFTTAEEAETFCDAHGIKDATVVCFDINMSDMSLAYVTPATAKIGKRME